MNYKKIGLGCTGCLGLSILLITIAGVIGYKGVSVSNVSTPSSSVSLSPSPVITPSPASTILVSPSMSPTSKTNTKATQKPTTQQTTQVKQEPKVEVAKPEIKEKLTISNTKVNTITFGDSIDFDIVGEVKNNDSIQHSATIKATFYDEASKIIGTAAGAVNDVQPGETKTFNLMTLDNLSGYKNYKVQVDTLL